MIDDLDDLEQLEELRHEYGDDLSIKRLRKIRSQLRKEERARAKRRKRRGKELRLVVAAPGRHPTRPWWRDDGRRWLRTDNQNWPHRPPDVLEAELDRFDREFPRRTGPDRWETVLVVPRARLRRVPRAPATLPIRIVRDAFSFQRRIASFQRLGHHAAAEFYGRQAEARRRQVAALPVRVPWGGRLLGHGVAP
jgi:hypothetical protein